MKTKASLVPNPDHKTRKITMTSANKNITRFYLQKRNKTRLWQENTPKTGVKQIKGNGEFYFYLYPLGT
jgi:hypothetical protein